MHKKCSSLLSEKGSGQTHSVLVFLSYTSSGRGDTKDSCRLCVYRKCLVRDLSHTPGSPGPRMMTEVLKGLCHTNNPSPGVTGTWDESKVFRSESSPELRSCARVCAVAKLVLNVRLIQVCTLSLGLDQKTGEVYTEQVTLE